MLVKVGCEFIYESSWPTPAVMQVRPRPDGDFRVLDEAWRITPPLALHAYSDIYGNTCQRMVIPAGDMLLSYDAMIEVSGQADEVAPDAVQLPVEELPDEVLLYTLPSRFCLSDTLSDMAWQLFGTIEPGWARVQAICDWVHGNIRFQYGTSNSLTTSADVCSAGVGVCRDFAHLAVTFCRALIGVPPPDAPMDFCAWMEVYLAGRWWTFDPRNNEPRIGRVLVGRGRDALDVAMITTYGSPRLTKMTVWADEALPASGDGAGTVEAQASLLRGDSQQG